MDVTAGEDNTVPGDADGGDGRDDVRDGREPVGATKEELAQRRTRADKATRGALAAILCLEALCVLLVPRTIAQTSTGLSGGKTAALLVLAVLLVAVAFLLRRSWAIGVGSLLHLPFTATSLWVPPFIVIAVVFIAIWLYLLNLRHELLGTPGGLRLLVS